MKHLFLFSASIFYLFSCSLDMNMDDCVKEDSYLLGMNYKLVSLDSVTNSSDLLTASMKINETLLGLKYDRDRILMPILIPDGSIGCGYSFLTLFFSVRNDRILFNNELVENEIDAIKLIEQYIASNKMKTYGDDDYNYSDFSYIVDWDNESSLSSRKTMFSYIEKFYRKAFSTDIHKRYSKHFCELEENIILRELKNNSLRLSISIPPPPPPPPPIPLKEQ